MYVNYLHTGSRSINWTPDSERKSTNFNSIVSVERVNKVYNLFSYFTKFMTNCTILVNDNNKDIDTNNDKKDETVTLFMGIFLSSFSLCRNHHPPYLFPNRLK